MRIKHQTVRRGKSHMYCTPSYWEVLDAVRMCQLAYDMMEFQILHFQLYNGQSLETTLEHHEIYALLKSINGCTCASHRGYFKLQSLPGPDPDIVPTYFTRTQQVSWALANHFIITSYVSTSHLLSANIHTRFADQHLQA